MSIRIFGGRKKIMHVNITDMKNEKENSEGKVFMEWLLSLAELLKRLASEPERLNAQEYHHVLKHKKKCKIIYISEI